MLENGLAKGASGYTVGMRTRLNDGRELRRGSIRGTQPGRPEKLIEDDPPGHLKRRRRSDYKPVPDERVSATGVVRRKGISTPEPRPLRHAHEDRLAEPVVEEWDNPYLKRKVPKWEAQYRARCRAAQIKAASDPANPVDLAAIRERDGSRCCICKKPLEDGEIDFDHVIPLSRKGKHTPENLKVCCKPCNRWKGDRLVTLL